MRSHSVAIAIAVAAAGLPLVTGAATASEAILEVATPTPRVEPSSVDTVSCTTPLKGNACLLVTCGNRVNQPI